jgi:hypothetical protein
MSETTTSVHIEPAGAAVDVFSTAQGLRQVVVIGDPSSGALSLVNGRLPVDGSAVTQPVSVASVPLPSGAATEATLSALNTKIPASPATAGNQTTANTSLATIAGAVSSNKVQADVITMPTVTVASSALTSLDTKTPSLGQAAMAASSPVVIASNQSAIPVSGTFNPTTPTAVKYGQATVAVTNTAVALTSNVVTGVVVQALAGNAGNVVVGDSSATTANAYQLQPGQAVGVSIDNTNRLYVNGTAGDGVCFIGS